MSVLLKGGGMATPGPAGAAPLHDRALLLSGSKRNQLLKLWEIQRYGADSFSDADYLCIYGLKPADWYARGVRLLGRTAVECTRDRLGDQIGKDIAEIVRTTPAIAAPVVIDPFAGSGNTLYWILRHLPGSKGIGFELDDAVFALSSRNLSIVGAPVEFIHQDYVVGLKNLALLPGQLLVVFVAPPWGDALSESTGLNLCRTAPPVPEIIDRIGQAFPTNKILYAAQVYESLEPQSLAEVKAFLDWSALRIYDLNAPGKNHGILLGTRGWTV
jgi:hypothetical protein